jgi:hypothetical protein
MVVRGHTDHAVDLCGEDSADGKRQCLGKGQTMLTKPPSQAEIQECWSEAIIKRGLSPSGRSGCSKRGMKISLRNHVWQCIQAVSAHQKPLARFHAIAEALPANEQIPGGTEPKKYGETRYGSRVTMSERIYNVISVLNSNMDMYQYIFQVTSPSLCLSYTYTDSALA